jgi:uncharacterized protein YndB with AHSA1/START domain
VEHRCVSSSPSFTIGVEEEYLIVDAATGHLRPRAPAVLPAAMDALGDQVQPELSLAQVEVETVVCTSLDEVRSELGRLRAEVIAAAEEAGTQVLAAGTHPFADWREQAITPKGRYVELEPPHRLVLSWGYAGSGVLPPGSSTVEIRLVEQEGATLVELEHRDLPAGEQAGHASGWPHYLARLGLVAAGRDPGADPGHV